MGWPCVGGRDSGCRARKAAGKVFWGGFCCVTGHDATSELHLRTKQEAVAKEALPFPTFPRGNIYNTLFQESSFCSGYAIGWPTCMILAMEVLAAPIKAPSLFRHNIHMPSNRFRATASDLENIHHHMQDYYKAVASFLDDWSVGAAPPPSRGQDYRSQPDYADHRPPYDHYGTQSNMSLRHGCAICWLHFVSPSKREISVFLPG